MRLGVNSRMVVSDTNFEPQIICALPLAGIEVDATDFESVHFGFIN